MKCIEKTKINIYKPNLNYEKLRNQPLIELNY